MKIITLVGNCNTGKTTTLKKLIKRMIEDNESNLLEIEDVSGRYTTYLKPDNIDKIDKLTKTQGDVFARLQYRSMIIGVSTAGDSRWNIENKLEILKDQVDLFICASRYSGESLDYVNELELENEVFRVYKIGCVGKETDWKYSHLKNCSDKLSIQEILKILGEKL